MYVLCMYVGRYTISNFEQKIVLVYRGREGGVVVCLGTSN